MAALTMDALKEWVGNVEERQCAEGYVLLDLTHNYLKNQYTEIQFDTGMTIKQVKEKLYTIFGTHPDHMNISLSGVPLTDESALLSAYNPKSRQTIHCVDTDQFSLAKGGGLEDVSQVEKYEMTDEEYDKRENTYRAYKKKMLAQDPNWVPKHVADARARRLAERGEEPALETLEEVGARMKVGDRCEVVGGRRGEIKWIGELKEATQHVYVGIEFDDMEGSNDGTFSKTGVRYFEAKDKFGAFIISPKVKAGDFPEIDEFASDDEDVDEEL